MCKTTTKCYICNSHYKKLHMKQTLQNNTCALAITKHYMRNTLCIGHYKGFSIDRYVRIQLAKNCSCIKCCSKHLNVGIQMFNLFCMLLDLTLTLLLCYIIKMYSSANKLTLKKKIRKKNQKNRKKKELFAMLDDIKDIT